MHAITTCLMGHMYTNSPRMVKIFLSWVKRQGHKVKTNIFSCVSFPDKIRWKDNFSLTRLIQNMYTMMDTALMQNEGHRSKVKVTRSYHFKNRSSGLGAVLCTLRWVMHFLPYSVIAILVCVYKTTTPWSSNDIKVKVKGQENWFSRRGNVNSMRL